MRTLYQEIFPPYFIVKYKPINREEKRLFDREYEKVVKELLFIDFKFVAELFGDEDWVSYQQLFTHYNAMYKEVATKLIRTTKLKFLEVNPDYFWQEYKPIES